MKIYGLCGQKQSGKNTFAIMAKEYLHNGTRDIALADPLKKFCIDYLDLSLAGCYGSDDDKNAIVGTWSIFGEKIRSKFQKNKDDKISNREILQIVGTEIFRDCFRPTFWVDLLKQKLDEITLIEDNVGLIFITDVRFENEIQMIKEMGGKTVRIIRDLDRYGLLHRSEAGIMSMSNDDFDYVINNSGSLVDLKESVLDFLVLEEEL